MRQRLGWSGPSDALRTRSSAWRTARPTPVARPATPPDALVGAAEIDAVLNYPDLIEALRDLPHRDHGAVPTTTR